jgi:3'-5' exoribonuclease
MLTGVLFHDCGKLWENTYPEHGFTQKLDLFGELMSHIPIGIEIVNKLWHAEITPNAEWCALSPTNDHTRFHLLHLIASHHGELQFGSPVLPRTPEAFALHYIDNLDAKLEMLSEAYTKSQELAPGIYERVFPLSTNLVMPLPAFVDAMESPEGREVPEDSSTG